MALDTFLDAVQPAQHGSFGFGCSRLQDSGEKPFSKKKCEKRAGA